MNILIITQLYPQPDDQGDNKPTHTVEYFAKEWVLAGHNVVVCHCSSKFPLLFYLIPSFVKNRIAGKTSNIIPPIESRKKIVRSEYGIKIYRFPMIKLFPGRGYSRKFLKKQAKNICMILNKKETFEPDLVLGHFANPSTELVSLLSKKYNCMSSIVFHNDCNTRNIDKYRLRESVSNIKAIGVRSVIDAYNVKSLLNLNELPFICYSGVPDSYINNSCLECKKHSFAYINYLFVGSMIKRKNLDSVIKAYDKIHHNDNNSTFRIIGGGAEEKNSHDLVKALDNHNIKFLGRVDRTEVMDAMEKANVFTLISDFEVFGMVYFEAMLQGCLVIASKGGGFDGIIVDGVNGFICEPGNELMLFDIYKRIEEMSENERNKIGQNAIDTAKKYSESSVAKQYLNDILERNNYE